MLVLIARSPVPVEASGLFGRLNPIGPGTRRHGLRREAWMARQLGLYGAHLGLHEKDLVRVVVPAAGERGDLVAATDAGHAVLG